MFPSASRIRRQLMAKETRRARRVRRRRPARPAPPAGPAGACAFRRPLARTSAGRGPRRDPAPCSSAKCVGRIGNASGPNRTDPDAGGSRAATPPPARRGPRHGAAQAQGAVRCGFPAGGRRAVSANPLPTGSCGARCRGGARAGRAELAPRLPRCPMVPRPRRGRRAGQQLGHREAALRRSGSRAAAETCADDGPRRPRC